MALHKKALLFFFSTFVVWSEKGQGDQYVVP
ncbi:hypothetical protein ALP64_201252 [Pseudomonas syringae pv. actinidiae]|uniref:Uncharacterized protein n=1 Tax=Pseudomonas syringae pv. actinidiae TaxID=103796 RepID=A0A2V0Q8R4_PSESF|nr:hypothetical protein ALP64_201252 [Pseudomonas syringae pv. actinidiae]BBI42771.1 hypothetical protein KPSA1B_101486 [Pseudomonas syringae pv. actinidiae]GBH09423.1 hypothetical protein KPSA1_02818 [Pseudomonas syringae pv. actinidiae]